jgi:hypothetical protein
MTTYLVGDADAHFLMCSSFILARFPWHITLSLRHNKNLVYVSLSQCKRAYLGHIIPIVFQAHSIFHVWSATLGRGTRCVLGYRDQIGRLHGGMLTYIDVRCQFLPLAPLHKVYQRFFAGLQFCFDMLLSVLSLLMPLLGLVYGPCACNGYTICSFYS